MPGRGPQEWPRPGLAGARGVTSLELLLVAAVLVVLTGIGIPGLLGTIDRSRGLAATRYVAARAAAARLRAVSRSASVALRFETGARGTTIATVEDGDRDGVRSDDIVSQVDRVIEAPLLLTDLFPGVDIGILPLTGVSNAVELGGTDLLSFSPNGTSTSGTVYVRDRAGTQWAVRVLGVTARARVLRFDPATGAWVHAG